MPSYLQLPALFAFIHHGHTHQPDITEAITDITEPGKAIPDITDITESGKAIPDITEPGKDIPDITDITEPGKGTVMKSKLQLSCAKLKCMHIGAKLKYI